MEIQTLPALFHHKTDKKEWEEEEDWKMALTKRDVGEMKESLLFRKKPDGKKRKK
jgi:hypothetical protein